MVETDANNEDERDNEKLIMRRWLIRRLLLRVRPYYVCANLKHISITVYKNSNVSMTKLRDSLESMPFILTVNKILQKGMVYDICAISKGINNKR